MPVSRQTTEAMNAAVAETYARAEVRLLSLIARHLEAGAGSPQWAETKLAELQLFRRRAAGVMDAAHAEAVGDLQQALQQAYLRGAAAGQGDLDRAGVELELPPQQAERAVQALAHATVGALDETRPRVLRSVDDAYRRAVTRAVAGTITGASTRLQDAQVALDDLARQGITGYVDKAGRRWQLATYTEMATRSATAQAAVNGHLDRLDQAGIPLVIVSNSSRECELCRPWEGKVLARGPVAALLPNPATGEMVRVQVDGTVAEALAAGLMHPNCTHNLSAFIPGITKRETNLGNTEGYAERQQLRAMERKVREWKRRQAVAVTPEAKRKADAKVREWQAAIKDHTDRTGLPRKRNREQLAKANGQVLDLQNTRTPAPALVPEPVAAPVAFARLSKDEARARFSDGTPLGDKVAAKVKRAYASGQHTVVIETAMTEAQTEVFLQDIAEVLTKAGDQVTGRPVAFRVPAGDPKFRGTKRITGGYVRHGDSTVYVNPKVASGELDKVSGLGQLMPAAEGAGFRRYTVTHELGHIMDNTHEHTHHDGGRTSSGIELPREKDDAAQELFREWQYRPDGLSKYGNANVHESYAEAWAQWVLGGPGTSQVADAYAGRYGWK